MKASRHVSQQLAAAVYRHRCKIGVFESSPLEEDRELAAQLDTESHEMRASATKLLLGLLAPDSEFARFAQSFGTRHDGALAHGMHAQAKNTL